MKIRFYNIEVDGVVPREVYIDDMHEYEDIDDVLADHLDMRVLSFEYEVLDVAPPKDYKLDLTGDFPVSSLLPTMVRVDIASLDKLIERTRPHLIELGGCCSEIVYYSQFDRVAGAEFFCDTECELPWDFAEFGILCDVVIKVFPIGAIIIWEGDDGQGLHLHL
jgi:hypothetical protein